MTLTQAAGLIREIDELGGRIRSLKMFAGAELLERLASKDIESLDQLTVREPANILVDIESSLIPH